MSTNYYWIKTGICSHCGGYRDRDVFHIGKSSPGWCFALHVDDELDVHDLVDWQDLWLTGGTIVNEYDDVISSERMTEIITIREGHMEKPKLSAFCKANHAIPGPNRLARRIVDGRYCVGHGEGTWDKVAGYFC